MPNYAVYSRHHSRLRVFAPFIHHYCELTLKGGHLSLAETRLVLVLSSARFEGIKDGCLRILEAVAAG